MSDSEEGTRRQEDVLTNLLQHSDLFDTGECDSDEERGSSPPTPGSHHTDSPSPSPPPPTRGKQRRKKVNGVKNTDGADKKPRKLKKSEVHQLHSESQRLIRESSVTLPSYQPKAKTLDCFLSKLRSRQPTATTSKDVKGLNREVGPAPRTPSAVAPRCLDNLLGETSGLLSAHTESLESKVDTLSPVDNSLRLPNSGVTQDDNESRAMPAVCGGSGALAETVSDVVCGPGVGCEEEEERRGEGESVDDGSSQQMPVPCGGKTDGMMDGGEVVSGEKEEEEEEAGCCLEGTTEQPVEKRTERGDCGQPKQCTLDLFTSAKPVAMKKSSLRPLPAPAQRTISALFSAKAALGAKSEESQSPLEVALPSPQLSSADDFLLGGEEELTIEVPSTHRKELKGMELFQHRFMKHVDSQRPHSQSVDPPLCGEGEEDVSEMSQRAIPLVPEEVASKLKGKPGAVREHWRVTLRRQLSQRKAEERKAAEEVRKMYNEEEEEEEEEEMTDGDTTDAETSDEEYAEKEKAVDPDSDVCSDLDEQEGNKEEEEEKEKEEEKEEEEEEKEEEEAEEEGLLSDEEDAIHLPRKLKTHRLLDSDEEEGGGGGGESPTKPPVDLSKPRLPVPSLSEETCSMSVFGEAMGDSLLCNTENSHGAITWDLIDGGGGGGEGVKTERRSSLFVDPGEASMGPLVYHDSNESEESNQAGEEEEEEGEGERERCTQLVGEEVESNSLELSLAWDASLPPAQQPRRDGTGSDRDSRVSDLTELTLLKEDSVLLWQQTRRSPSPSPSVLSSQEASLEETQFLDEDGFICEKKKPHRHSAVSAIKAAVEATQDSSPSELLALCSGQFEDAAGEARGRGRERHLSDSSSSQAVRELLGLPVSLRPKSVGISKLLGSSTMEGTSDGTQVSQMSEVIGLCSGVFLPSTAPSLSGRQQPSAQTLGSRQSGGTSDGMSDSESSDSGSDGENAILRWAKRHSDGQVKRRRKRRKREREEGESLSEDEDMPVLVKKRHKRPHPRPTKEERLEEFVESEAELSGEDVGSEEEEIFSGAEGEDRYEEEGGGSDVPLSDSELWDQVNKAHMKHTMADDKADLREFKERYLAEGDLYEDGLAMKNGFFRTRRFNRMDSEQGSVDLFAEDQGAVSEEEGEEEASSQAEAKRRRDRLEREEFMKKCREQEDSLLTFDEESQSILNIIRDTTSHSLMNTPVSNGSASKEAVSTGGKARFGSFLRHKPSTLRRLSSLTATTPNASLSGKGFVFQRSDANTPTAVKSAPNKRAGGSIGSRGPPSKKPALEKSCSLSNASIFSVLK